MRTVVENSSPSRMVTSASDAPALRARETMSEARARRLVVGMVFIISRYRFLPQSRFSRRLPSRFPLNREFIGCFFIEENQLVHATQTQVSPFFEPLCCCRKF